MDRLEFRSGRPHVLERHIFKRDESVLLDELHSDGKSRCSCRSDRPADIERIDPAVRSCRHDHVTAELDIYVPQDTFVSRADGIPAHCRPERDFSNGSVHGKRNDLRRIWIHADLHSPVHWGAALAVFSRRFSFCDLDRGKVVSNVEFFFFPVLQLIIHFFGDEFLKIKGFRRRVLFFIGPDRVGSLNAEIARQVDHSRKCRGVCRHSGLGSTRDYADGQGTGKGNEAARWPRNCRPERRVNDQSGIFRAQRQGVSREGNVPQKSRRIQLEDRNCGSSPKSNGPADGDTARKVDEVRRIFRRDHYVRKFLKFPQFLFRQRNVRISGLDLRFSDLCARGIFHHGVSGTSCKSDLRA